MLFMMRKDKYRVGSAHDSFQRPRDFSKGFSRFSIAINQSSQKRRHWLNQNGRACRRRARRAEARNWPAGEAFYRFSFYGIRFPSRSLIFELCRSNGLQYLPDSCKCSTSARISFQVPQHHSPALSTFSLRSQCSKPTMNLINLRHFALGFGSAQAIPVSNRNALLRKKKLHGVVESALVASLQGLGQYSERRRREVCGQEHGIPPFHHRLP